MSKPRSHNTKPSKERALLVGLARSAEKIAGQDHLEELALLADTAGVEIVDSTLNIVRQIDPATFLGKGKVAEIAEMVAHNDVQIAIFDEDLSPAQTRNLEKAFKCRVIDRSALILDIFAKRARTREAKTQVELAQLEYLLPRLTRAWTHLERQAGGGVFTKGPGETQLETDRRLVGNRIALLKEELKKIEIQRKTRRESRKEVFSIALVGYTNAGKSTLLNALSDASVFVEDRLFATLDTTIRQVFLEKDYPCVISDTVGFIRKLPHDLVASFRSTLEEVRDADLLLHVCDASHHALPEHIETVNRVLNEIGADLGKMRMVFNKIDKVTDDAYLKALARDHPDASFISASRKIGLEKLRVMLLDSVKNDYVVDTVAFDVRDGKLSAMVHYLAEVLSVKHTTRKTTIRYRCKKSAAEKIRKEAINRTDFAKLN